MPTRQEEEFREWMEMPEVEELPEGGPLAPWMKAGREVVVPTAGKVFYVNGYTFLTRSVGLRILGEEEELEENPKVIKRVEGFVKRIIGEVPPGELGVDYLPMPFASVPVRLEKRNTASVIADHIEGVGKAIGLPFMRIISEEDFADVVEAMMAYEETPTVVFEHLDVAFVNAFVVNRLYGGSEEGGWWYNAGEPIASIPVLNLGTTAVGPGEYVIDYDEEAIEQAKKYLKETIGWESKYPLHSVLGADSFSVFRQDHFATPFPEGRPHYE